MAKSSRASSVKSNNQRLKANVFGPVESERTARLSAKLLELASQPKAKPEVEMKDAAEEGEKSTAADKDDETMEIDSAASKSRKKSRGVVHRSGIAKRKAKKSAIVFPTRNRKQMPKKKTA
ncbi:hypothetical protein DL546_002696 [Coniochaeta pulveracea]|uniref:DUF2423 domain-containing protein n=1 Tax=Coniochaeta pulveracea TaxID=177199 RepID=A0A420Y1Q8_9PEZI|nr:hypothetical protein DL546_002696 [Coniochaeta pulveracea]